MVDLLNSSSGENLSPEFLDERKGGVRHSKASVEKISKIGYVPEVYFREGLKMVFDWYKKNNSKKDV